MFIVIVIKFGVEFSDMWTLSKDLRLDVETAFFINENLGIIKCNSENI